MKTSDPHIPDDRAREALDEPRPGAYEPPSVTELGTFRHVTAGDATGGQDEGSASLV
jgi:hypothetical protein